MNYLCTPMSRVALQNYATQIRETLHLSNVLEFPAVYFLEALSVLISDDDFYFSCIADDEWPGSETEHAYYDLEDNCVYIRESVYVGAYNGNGRDRMTIVHECCHVLLLKHSGLKLARSFDTKIAAYCDPEWQAKCLAGELMIPANLVAGKSPDWVVRNCKVSYAAACYQLKKIEEKRKTARPLQ